MITLQVLYGVYTSATQGEGGVQCQGLGPQEEQPPGSLETCTHSIPCSHDIKGIPQKITSLLWLLLFSCYHARVYPTQNLNKNCNEVNCYVRLYRKYISTFELRMAQSYLKHFSNFQI